MYPIKFFQILRESVLFMALGVVKLISFSLIIFEQFAFVLLLICLLLYFDLYHSVPQSTLR